MHGHLPSLPGVSALGLEHKLNAPQWGYTTAATWGLLSINPSNNLFSLHLKGKYSAPPSAVIPVRSSRTAGCDATADDNVPP